MKILKHNILLTITIASLLVINISFAQTNNSKNDSSKGHQKYKRGKLYDSKIGALTNTPTVAPDKAADRINYEFDLIKNPYTGKVPKNIKKLEQKFSKTHPKGHFISNHLSNAYSERNLGGEWTSRGPYNIGGRTRAFAIDINNESVFFAGGVSGGLWRSDNRGQNWQRVSKKDDNPSITDIVQDPRPNFQHLWYYSSGEFIGNSASEDGAAYQGSGIYKSDDYGLTWTQVDNSNDNNLVSVIDLDFISHLAVHPVSGNVYASAPDGIWTIGNEGLEKVLDLPNCRDTFITISSSGTMYATASFENGSQSAGIYINENESGWVKISPSEMTNASFGKTIAAVTPSNENIVWFTAYNPDNNNHFLWKYNKTTNSWTNKSATIANIASDIGSLNFQYGYNMVLKVHPTDSDVIFIGGTNLYRTNDGFNSNLSKSSWIGGYHKNGSAEVYTNHHPDQHQLLFVPSNPSQMINTNDGGVYKTNNCLANQVSWTSLNNGYLTTQSHAISIDYSGETNHIISGFQDNGTWLSDSDTNNAPWINKFGGDGSYNAIANNGKEHYVSFQYGNIYKLKADNPSFFARVTPGTSVAPDQFSFLTPFKIDPNNNNIMYLANGRVLLVNPKLDALVSGTYEQNTKDWFRVSGISTYPITSIDVSTYPVQHRVYYGAENGAFYRVDNANLSTAKRSHNLASGKGLGAGQISCVYVDPTDADRVFIVKSNYGVKSIWLTEDGGQSFSSISGNLEENNDGSGNGPSVRWITSIGNNEGYLVGTSTGLYSTTELNGDSTIWSRETINLNNDELEDVLVTQVKSRKDGMTAIATHGNGIFNTYFEVSERPENQLSVNPMNPIALNNINPSKTIDLNNLFESKNNSPIQITVTENSNPNLANISIEDNSIIISGITENTEGNMLLTLQGTSQNEKASVVLDITIRAYGIFEQYHTSSYNTPSNYDFTGSGRLAQCADDFFVPEGFQWQINKVIAFGSSLGYRIQEVDKATVEIYDDNNGKPGNLIYSSGKVSDLNILPDEKGDLELAIPLNNTLELSSGTYWISTYAYFNYYPYFLNWVWYNTSTVAGNESYFKNPDGLWFYSSNEDNPYFIAKDWTKQSEVFKSEPTDMLFFIMGDTNSLSNDKTNQLNLVLSPNPNNGNFNISGISKTSSPINIEVIDLQGRTIHKRENIIITNNNLNVNLPEKAKGIYVIKVKSDTDIFSKKIFVR